MNVTYRPPHRFSVSAADRKEMKEWLDDNNMEYLEIDRTKEQWDFCICSYTEEQKSQLAWFKFKWMKFDGTDA